MYCKIFVQLATSVGRRKRHSVLRTFSSHFVYDVNRCYDDSSVGRSKKESGKSRLRNAIY